MGDATAPLTARLRISRPDRCQTFDRQQQPTDRGLSRWL